MSDLRNVLLLTNLLTVNSFECNGSFPSEAALKFQIHFQATVILQQ